MLHSGETTPVQGKTSGSANDTTSVRATNLNRRRRGCRVNITPRKKTSQSDAPAEQIEPLAIDGNDAQPRLFAQALKSGLDLVRLEFDRQAADAFESPQRALCFCGLPNSRPFPE